MHPFRPPFGVPSRPGNPHTTQPQQNFNFYDMDPNVFSYAAYLCGSNPFIPTTYDFAPLEASQPSTTKNCYLVAHTFSDIYVLCHFRFLVTL
ncbi:hypothetical protein Hanom_Chr11g00992871 [Helianthus anomalus]